MNRPLTVEICVDSIDSALAAACGGAHRLELCGSLAEGGITPSAGLIAAVRDLVSIELYVMVRPRSGDFCYSAEEFAAMKRDIIMAKQLRADGVVFGMLNEDGEIDMSRCRELLDHARPLGTTFHRAFDMSRDLEKSLADLITLGFDRVLTSGGAQKAPDAVPVLARLNELAKDRIAVMAGSGVTSRNVATLVSETRVREVHASARRIELSRSRYRKEHVSMGSTSERDYERAVADEAEVRSLVRAVAAE